MTFRRVGLLAGIVSVLGFVAQYVPSVLLQRWIDGGLGGGFPMLGTAGQTVTLYSLLVETVGPVVTLALAVGLGYRTGRRFDVANEYRRFGEAIAVGSLAGITAIWAVQQLAGQVVPTTAPAVALSLVVLGSLILRISLVVTVGIFAGVALSQFGATGEPPAGPTAEAGNPSSVPDTSATDTSATDDPDATSSAA